MWARCGLGVGYLLLTYHRASTPRHFASCSRSTWPRQALGSYRVHLPAHGQRRRAARIFSGRVASAVHHRLPRDRVPALPAMSPLYLHRQRDLARSAWKATDGMCHCASLAQTAESFGAFSLSGLDSDESVRRRRNKWLSPRSHSR